MAAVRNTHQTTIRFTEELWAALEFAAERRGVSVAHYVRDAARASLGQQQDPANPLSASEQRRQLAFERTFEHAESTAALWEQGRLARERAQFLRAESRKQRGLA